MPSSRRYQFFDGRLEDERISGLDEDRLILRLRKVIRKEGVTRNAIAIFRQLVSRHYAQHRRSLPWRETRNPYRILVSEIMLQQTQVERVLEKYTLFVKTFPDFSSLAQAPLPEILRVWEGLGYNRRAIALRSIALAVVTEFHGRLPSSKAELMKLPGIGDYTASAVLAFAFNQPSVFIETNIRRVFIYFFCSDRDGISDSDIIPILERTLQKNNTREWYYALMDYGAMLGKKIPNPNRRSAHYKRQTRFQGSDRQARGMVISALLRRRALSKKEMEAELGLTPQRVEENLVRLIREGFVKKEGRRYAIAR
jgi:A/G-specific adenine glycosylase